MSADTAPQLSTIPAPPPGLGHVRPAHELAEWVRANVLDEAGPIHNPDHAHLVGFDAAVGWLWMPDTLRRSGSRILGTCATGKPSGDAWAQAVKREQLERWFGDVPDFVVSLCARHAAHELEQGRPANVLAVVEHELYHAAVERDQYGAERFDRFGNPRWGVRPHDVESFVGCVRRYGTEATGTTALIQAAMNEPEIGRAQLEGICGTCRSTPA